MSHRIQVFRNDSVQNMQKQEVCGSIDISCLIPPSLGRLRWHRQEIFSGSNSPKQSIAGLVKPLSFPCQIVYKFFVACKTRFCDSYDQGMSTREDVPLDRCQIIDDILSNVAIFAGLGQRKLGLSREVNYSRSRGWRAAESTGLASEVAVDAVLLLSVASEVVILEASCSVLKWTLLVAVAIRFRGPVSSSLLCVCQYCHIEDLMSAHWNCNILSEIKGKRFVLQVSRLISHRRSQYI